MKKAQKEAQNVDEDNAEKNDQPESEDDFEIKAEGIGSLACFASNKDDQLLTIKDEGEDSDEEDFVIKPTDNLLVCGQIDREVCTLNAFVYNNIDPAYYIHHDIILPSYPICVEWLDFDPTLQETNEIVNYLAIGTLNPWIEIWDLDMVESLEPEFILGSQKKKKKKANPEKKIKIQGHKDAVLDLSWNFINRNLLASGSADKSIILWDLDSLKMATRIKQQTEKIQSLKFHPVEAFSLLSGCVDGTVALYDCRNPKSNFKTWTYLAVRSRKSFGINIHPITISQVPTRDMSI